MSLPDSIHPQLRLVDAQPITYEGETYLLLRDPLELTEKTLLVPQPYVPILALLDGSRNLATLRAALALRYGLFLTPQRIEEFVAALDDARLLDNEHSRQAIQEAQEHFRQAPFRTPASAGASYPENPQALSSYLQGFIDNLNGSTPTANGSVRGIISPHIDYQRGGPVYAQVWSQAGQAVREADLAIVFGTDHFSEGYPISLTRQNYATPYGTLPTAVSIVDELVEVVGEEAAFAGELHHRKEHSIELAAVWMHHMRAGKPIEMAPILVGSLERWMQPDENQALPLLDGVIEVLQRAMQGRKAVVVAAGDLAHVGPAFGGEAVDPGKLVALKDADDELIEAICRGDAETFFSAIERVQDENNVCGVSPIYLALRLLGVRKGQRLGYSVCPADQNQTSVVTVCGVTLE